MNYNTTQRLLDIINERINAAENELGILRGRLQSGADNLTDKDIEEITARVLQLHAEISELQEQMRELSKQQ